MSEEDMMDNKDQQTVRSKSAFSGTGDGSGRLSKESVADKLEPNLAVLGNPRHEFGITVKLSAENQLLLNVPKPSRAFIPTSLLEKHVKGFRVGNQILLQASYVESGAKVYHKYAGGKNWVPTAPADVGKPRDVFTLKVARLRKTDFLRNFPVLRFRNNWRYPWVSDESRIQVAGGRDSLELHFQQSPSVEGSDGCMLRAQVLGNLVFQTGSIFLDISVLDAFATRRRLRLYHNGHRRTGLAVDVGNTFFPVRFVSFDGSRLRMRYRWTGGIAGTIFYLKEPSLLYQLGEASELPLDSYNVAGVDSLSFIEDVEPIRSLEGKIVRNGSCYESGRVGAEIAYTILQKKFKCKELVLQEPARRGADLNTRDGEVVGEARLISGIKPTWLKTQIEKDLMQMIRKLRRDLRYSKAVVGYAVLSYTEAERIKSLIARLDSPGRQVRA